MPIYRHTPHVHVHLCHEQPRRLDHGQRYPGGVSPDPGMVQHTHRTRSGPLALYTIWVHGVCAGHRGGQAVPMIVRTRAGLL